MVSVVVAGAASKVLTISASKKVGSSMSTSTGPVELSAPPSSISVMVQIAESKKVKSSEPPVGPKVMSSS